MTNSESLLPLDSEEEGLIFLRDEGLELLALFKRVRDKHKRRLIVDLIRVIVDDQPDMDGACISPASPPAGL